MVSPIEKICLCTLRRYAYIAFVHTDFVIKVTRRDKGVGYDTADGYAPPEWIWLPRSALTSNTDDATFLHFNYMINSPDDV
jgi:hypothetical protein